MKKGSRVGSRIEIKSHVLREIRQQARASMSAEICGVLVGDVQGDKTTVDVAIAGEAARQGGSHVTFTQETWEHIYAVKDAKYPDKRIVGWYHSHPGFGIFLSEHDTFIHRNFFSDPSQIAWVYDPHSDEEGCFAWRGGEITRVSEIALCDDPAHSQPTRPDEFLDPSLELPPMEITDAKNHSRRRFPWVWMVLSHLFVLILGAVLSLLLFPPIIVISRGVAR